MEYARDFVGCARDFVEYTRDFVDYARDLNPSTNSNVNNIFCNNFSL